MEEYLTGKIVHDQDTWLQAQTWKGRGWEGKATLDLHSPFSPSFPFPCVACHACCARSFILSASVLSRLWEQRYCWEYNIPDFTRHGCCHQVTWNVILYITKLKHQNRLLRVVKIIECIVPSLLRITENNMGGFFRIVFYTILSFHHTWSKGKWFIYVLVAHNFKTKLLLSCF